MKSRRFKKSRRQSRKRGGKTPEENKNNCTNYWLNSEYVTNQADCDRFISEGFDFPGKLKKMFGKKPSKDGYELPTIKEQQEDAYYNKQSKYMNEQNRRNTHDRNIVRASEANRINEQAIASYRLS